MIHNFKPHPLLVAVCFLALGMGCTTPRGTSARGEHHSVSSQGIDREALKDSTVDISYVLGHSRRRLVAWARNDTFAGQTLMDHQILRESKIDRRHYSEFFGKAEQFVSTPRRKPATQTPPDEKEGAACRTPFTVTVRVGNETQTLQGCRGEDNGALSHLVRDGEFLLYSKK